MIQPDGSVYFYSPLRTSFPCAHSFLYVVWTWNEWTPAFCGLCFLDALFKDEVPKKIHEHKQLAENGNPETSGVFLAHLQAQLGLHSPKPDEPLHQFRRAREQYSPKPPKSQLPVTYALWKLFGDQPKMAKPLLRMLLGQTENEIARQTGDSIYNIQTTVAKGIRTTLRYVR
jgi:hypothetical protein